MPESKKRRTREIMMTEYRELLQAALKTARKAYVYEPTREGKKEWMRLIKVCLEELNATHGRLIL